MKQTEQLLDSFIEASAHINNVVEDRAGQLHVSPHVTVAISSAKKLLPMVHEYELRNRIVDVLHDIYKELRKDIKTRGAVVNGRKHPALDDSLKAYRIINS